MGERLLLPGETRRTFLKKGVVGGILLLAGGVAAIAFRRSRLRTPKAALKVLSVAEYSVLAAVADRLIPAGDDFPPSSDVQCVEKVDALLVHADPGMVVELRRLIAVFENALTGLVFERRPTPFTQLSADEQDRVLLEWRDSRLVFRRSGYKALKNLVDSAYYASPEVYPAVGYPGPPEIVRMEPVQ